MTGDEIFLGDTERTGDGIIVRAEGRTYSVPREIHKAIFDEAVEFLFGKRKQS